jgi:1L-myo-inositol 1-phosphate cytidylyltransferase / CDP-L-myo-inositol myo-inositolphosphotransferase
MASANPVIEAAIVQRRMVEFLPRMAAPGFDPGRAERVAAVFYRSLPCLPIAYMSTAVPNPDRNIAALAPSAGTPPPILLVVPRRLGSADPAVPKKPEIGQVEILGLDLRKRAALAARRAGFAQTIFLTAEDAAFASATPFAGWGSLAENLTQSASPLVVIASDVLVEVGSMKQLVKTATETKTWRASDRLAVVPASAVAPALEALSADAGPDGFADSIDRLSRRMGPAAMLPPEADLMTIAGPSNVPEAERRLMRALVKDTDGFMAKHVERPISLAISRRLAATSITPNQMTLISVAVGLAGAPLFLSSLAPLQTIGALLFLAHSILDGCDGELARLKFLESRWGGILDFWGDNVVHGAVFACMAIGWHRANNEFWPLLLGACAVIATLGSAGIVYWRVMHRKAEGGPLYTSVSATPSRRFTRMLDALSRRDFIYLVVALALLGRADWFLLLTAIGAPIYFFILVFLTAHEGTAEGSSA